jgi:mRNA-degrading endonuclease HigB of HigAB toxin-antitoxin module
MIVVSTGVAAMSLFDAGKVCLFSKISGVITLDGKPAANALIVRTVNLTKNKVDETRTDQQGYFEMPAVFQRTVTQFLPQEFVANQEVVVDHQGKKYRVWSAVKRNPGEDSEARGKPFIVRCELNSAERGLIVDRSPIHTLCLWDVEPDPPIDWESE